MDPEPPQNKNEIIEAPSEVRRHLIKKYGLFFSVAIALIVLSLLTYQGYKTFLQKKETLNFRLQPQTTPYTPERPTSKLSLSAKNPNDPIAKIGEEVIYKKDLDYEITKYPASPGSDHLQLAMDRLTKSSIILQSGANDKLITLDPTIFNSLSKDYSKRDQAVIVVTNAVNNQADKISGYIISIWFLNDHVGVLGYEKAKQIALQKVTKLHNDVKSGKITIIQAGELIKNDSSLSQLDTAYKSNAIFNFTITKDQTTTWSKEMDQALSNANIGTVTDVFTIKSGDADSHQLVDAYYSFGQVSQRSSNSIFISYDDWFNTNKGKYAVQTF